MITLKKINMANLKINDLINLSAKSLLFCSFKFEQIGTTADVNAPSAVIRRNKFGNLNAIKNISEKIPAPKKAAIKISRMKPDIRLMNVSIAD